MTDIPLDGPVTSRYLTADYDPVLARIDAVLTHGGTSAVHVSVTGSDPEHGVTLADLEALRDAADRIGVPPGSRIKAFARGGVVRRLETIPAPVPCAPRDLPTDDDA